MEFGKNFESALLECTTADRFIADISDYGPDVSYFFLAGVKGMTSLLNVKT